MVLPFTFSPGNVVPVLTIRSLGYSEGATPHLEALCQKSGYWEFHKLEGVLR